MLLSPSQYRNAAKESLSKAQQPGRIILLHTSAVVLLSFLLTLADHLLDQQIATTGGLGGLGARAILGTVQYIFRLLPLVLLPFWQSGYLYYTIRVARGEPAGKNDLLEGFRRFGPVLRLKLLTGLLAIGMCLGCSYIASFIFVMSPWSTPIMGEMETLIASAAELSDTELLSAMMTVAGGAVVPLMVIFSICLLAGSFILFYQIRLAEFWLMDHPGKGALAALIASRKQMRGNWKRMLTLDLSFWWFLVLELLVSILGIGDVILNYFGISMSTDAFVTYLIFSCLYLWAHLMLYWWKKNTVSVTYAHAYLALCPDESETKV